jgi:hypothetical protein
MAGAAYDTEKAFDNMFIVDPFVTDPDKDSAYVTQSVHRFC